MFFRKKRDTIVVMDTSVLMVFPNFMKGNGCVFNVPMAAVRELDGLKDSDDLITRQKARMASRIIEDRRIPIIKRYIKTNDLGNWGDDRILGTALKIKGENPGKRVLLLTADRNMRLAASAYSLEAKDFWVFVKEGFCPGMKVPLWMKIVIAAGITMLAVSFKYLSEGDELKFLAYIAGWYLLTLIGVAAAMSTRNSRRQQSVVQYYNDGSSSADNGRINHGGHENSESLIEENLRLGNTDPDEYFFK